MSNPVGVRVATSEDMRFVASTWFHSVLKSAAPVSTLPFAVYRDGMEANIQRLLKRSTVQVAFATIQPDEILGYAVRDEKHNCMHHLYVKAPYRRQGIARSLLGATKAFTHPATPGAGKKFVLALNLSYNPRLAEP